MLDDTALIARCRTELPYVMEAFGELVKRHERYVFNVCRRYLGSENDAEDNTQEVFLRVFHALPNFEGRSQFRTWLFRITMNQCHEFAEKQKRHLQYSYDGSDEAYQSQSDNDQPETLLSAEEERDCVQRSLSRMRTQDMEILSLRFMGELSLEDISTTLSSKLSATKMRFYRAMEQFKAIYEKLCM
uniref:RNA polymerase sigma factor n=1 Tax=uncultured Thiotrichaceae bacterium TaxID=298394 RepID=A0A6S6U4W7_9GAMM|nr:MAG: RNA polymerase sigma factor [uncultured Thiotrichaceae bacterium]